MDEVVLAEVTRGPLVESVHRGAVAVCDADGGTVLALGNIEAPVFPRSAVKAIQALPLVESGAADAYGFDAAQLSLACASHSGEPDHVSTARAMLERAGLAETCLECGGHWASGLPVLLEQARRHDETPSDIYNNCSGKHSGMVCTAAHHGEDPAGYISHEHPVQERVRRALEEVTGARHDERNRAVDGCSIPTYAVPLRAMAQGFARMASGALPPDRARAAKRLLEACMAEPFHMAGTGRFCTRIMQALPGRIFAKTGAEGVFCGALPELGVGIALKCADGGTRAAEVAIAAICRRLLDDDALTPFAEPTLRNWNGIAVGAIRPGRDLLRA